MTHPTIEPAARPLVSSVVLPTPSDPGDLPDLYALTVTGACMEPFVFDGATCVFDKRRKPGRGDLVAIWGRPGERRPGDPEVHLKRLVVPPLDFVEFPMPEMPGGNTTLAIIVDQMNPMRSYTVFCERIMALHTLVHVLPAGER